jgi:hypothetical protein
MKKRSLKAITLNWPSYIQGRLFALIAICRGSSATTCVKTVNCGRFYHAQIGTVCKEERDTLPQMYEEMVQNEAQVKFVFEAIGVEVIGG